MCFTFIFLLFISSLLPLYHFAFVSYPLAPHMLCSNFKIILKSLVVGLLYFMPLSSIDSLHSGIIMKDNFPYELQSFSLPNNSLLKLFSLLFKQSRDLMLLFLINKGDLPCRKSWFLPERLIQTDSNNENDFSKADVFAKEEKPLCSCVLSRVMNFDVMHSNRIMCSLWIVKSVWMEK